MDNTFKTDEKLYRAVYPPEVMDMFWRKDGGVSSAAFADPRGLSVDRGDYRADDVVAASMKERFTGSIVYFYVKHANDAGAFIKYSPSGANPYHTLVLGSRETPLLSKEQRSILARKAVVL